MSSHGNLVTQRDPVKAVGDVIVSQHDDEGSALHLVEEAVACGVPLRARANRCLIDAVGARATAWCFVAWMAAVALWTIATGHLRQLDVDRPARGRQRNEVRRR